MRSTSFFSRISLATAVLSLGMAIPVVAAGLEQVESNSKAVEMSAQPLSERSELSQTPSSGLVALRRCVNRRVYHRGYYTRSFPLVGRRVYHPGYYTTQRVCS